MKRIVLLLTLSAFFFSVKAQTQKNNNKRKNNLLEIEDKMALKYLVDIFSTWADQKETQKQTFLFTEDATVETFIGGQLVTSLKGRQQIGEAFGNYLALFETVYHLNGQQTVTIHGEQASGISYCLVTLIGLENGKKMKTTSGVYYHDEYVKQNGNWLIAKRTSTFSWQEKTELAQ